MPAGREMDFKTPQNGMLLPRAKAHVQRARWNATKALFKEYNNKEKLEPDAVTWIRCEPDFLKEQTFPTFHVQQI